MNEFLQPEEFCVDDIFKGKYLIPVYQRPYRWGEKQVKQLLKDIEDAYSCFLVGETANADDSVLFAGTIFIKLERNVRNEYNVYTVVDGQQRITTITLLMMVVLNKLYLDNSEDDVVGEIRNYLWKKEERKNNKDLPVLTLGNIDHDIMQSLLNELFARRDIVKIAQERLENTTSEIEINLLSNLLTISNYISEISNKWDLLSYIDFIKFNVKVVSIKISTNMVKLFSIFESINSKGKPLDEIDLIKSYIFQHLDQEDYSEYLDKWGELIKLTNDKLNEYLIIFIRGNISYYKTSIYLDNFRTLATGSFMSYYGCTELSEVLKSFINDMLDQVKFYNMLTDYNLLKNNGVSEKSVAFFRMNNLAKYSTTNSLYFKLLSLRGAQRLDDKRFDFIVEYAFRFILTYQTISSRESKHAINVFSDIQNEIYNIAKTQSSTDIVDDHLVNSIKYIINKRIYDNAINNESLKSSIHNTMTFKKNKNVVKLLLAYLLELNEENAADYLKINAILSLGDGIHVDHTAPQSPKSTDDGFKYYQDGDFMILKPGQDFTENPNIERMPVEDFLSEYIHRFGNLRLEWANDNIKKSNKLIKLEEFDYLFNCNKHIKDRENSLIDKIIKSGFLISTDNYDFSPSDIKAKRRIEVTSDNTDNLSLKDYYPIGYSLFGTYFPLSYFSYRQFVIELFDELYELEKDRLVELANEHFHPTSSDRAYISNEKSDIRVPYVLGNAVYIETNLSSDYSIYFAFRVLDEMGLERSDLSITLEEK